MQEEENTGKETKKDDADQNGCSLLNIDLDESNSDRYSDCINITSVFKSIKIKGTILV